MKAQKTHFTQLLSLMFLAGILMIFSTACENECVSQWAECYNRCPSQEEGDQAVSNCMDDCRAKYPNGQPIDEFSQCVVACYNKSREACVDRCGDQLQRCLD